MNLEFLNTATAKELEQFKAVCNQLLSRTYVVRTLYRPGRGRVSNPDYTFLSIHYESVREYLSLLDWDLRRDDINGYFYVLNTDEANRCILSKRETAILLALRMLYDESQERLGLEQDALCSVREVLEKIGMREVVAGKKVASRENLIRLTADLPSCRPFRLPFRAND